MLGLKELITYLWEHDGNSLKWMLAAYLAIGIVELIFSKRRLFLEPELAWTLHESP